MGPDKKLNERTCFPPVDAEGHELGHPLYKARRLAMLYDNGKPMKTKVAEALPLLTRRERRRLVRAAQKQYAKRQKTKCDKCGSTGWLDPETLCTCVQVKEQV